MQLNKRTLLYTLLACTALAGSLAIGIAIGRSPHLLDAFTQDGGQEAQNPLLEKLEQAAQQTAQAPLLDPFSQSPLGSDPFRQLQQQMDQLFGSIGPGPSPFSFGGLRMGGGFANTAQAKIEVEESKDEYRVVISLSEGSDMELKTELEDNTLSISAQLRTEVQDNSRGRQVSSTSMSQISRSIFFDSPVDATGMQTEKSDSAVVIRVPKLS